MTHVCPAQGGKLVLIMLVVAGAEVMVEVSQ